MDVLTATRECGAFRSTAAHPKKLNVNVGTILSWRTNAKTGRVAFSTNGIGPRLEMWKMNNFLPK